MEVVIRAERRAAADWWEHVIAATNASKPAVVMGWPPANTMESVYGGEFQVHCEEGLDFSACHTFNLDEIRRPARLPSQFLPDIT